MLEKLGTRDTRVGSCQGDVGIMNWSRWYEDRLPRIHIMADLSDANEILHRSHAITIE